MGLFDKLKNILFEEDTVEIPVITKEKKQEELKVKEMKEEKEIESIVPKKPVIKETTPKEVELPVYKSEKHFDFPIFDEDEFEETKSRVSRNTNILEYETKKKSERRDRDVARGYAPQAEPVKEKAPFRPSPVISPVYGILDKNYKKEDLMPKEAKHAMDDGNRPIDVDMVRKKAFGTLEDDIERTMNTTTTSFYQEVSESKTIDELLMSSAEEVLDVPKEEDTSFASEVNRILETQEEDDYELPEDSGPLPTMEVMDRMERELNQTVPTQEALENDTLESDLFDLIDSMYEQREDGEA